MAVNILEFEKKCFKLSCPQICKLKAKRTFIFELFLSNRQCDKKS